MGKNGAANYQDGDDWGGRGLTFNHQARHSTSLFSRSRSGSWEDGREQEHLPVPGTVLGVLHMVVGGIVRMTPNILALLSVPPVQVWVKLVDMMSLL